MVNDGQVSLTDVRLRFRQHVRGLMHGQDSVKSTDLTQQAVAELEAAEPGFTELLIVAMGEQIQYEETLREMGTTRQASLIQKARNRIVNRTQLTAGERLMRWMEWDGSRHIRIGTATRPEIQRMTDIREARGTVEFAIASWWRGIASGLPDDTTTVEEVYTPDEIEDVIGQSDSAGGAPPLLPGP